MMNRLMKTSGLLLAGLIALGATQPGGFMPPAAAQAQNPADSQLQAAIAKSNAYVALMNRTMRATDSINRYKSWVNMTTGPTGKERYIDYGLYSLYDVRSEIEKALAAADSEPKVAELDESMKRYVSAYQALAPVITQASAYYDRKDYKSDNLAEGKALHQKLAPAAELYLKERAIFSQQMRGFKRGIDLRSLAAIEATEGRKARWQIRNVMIHAEDMIELMPSNAAPVVNLPPFDEALGRYAAVVKDFDTFMQANPGAVSGFESQPRSLLGKLRDFREKLARSKGDARRGAGNDITWIVNDYNMMVTMSENAVRFMR